jgi:hypothetical protein
MLPDIKRAHSDSFGGMNMLNLGFALLLAMTAAAADPVDVARKTFNNCMLTLHNENITAKASLPEFRKAADAGCQTEKDAFHAVIVKSERGFGSNAADAAAYADEEVQSIISSIKASYAENADNSAVLSLEK